ncbi:hypothetical protein ACFL39_00520 [Gemmatimonadota bacterium]
MYHIYSSWLGTLMANFLCAVPQILENNYQIGLKNGVWGVIEDYELMIKRVLPGDLLVFVVSGAFKSIHEINSKYYHESSLIWPSHNRGSVYPFRIRISPSIHSGTVLVSEIADRISFMKGKVHGGTIQGRNGVFNSKLNEQDMKLIIEKMS